MCCLSINQHTTVLPYIYVQVTTRANWPYLSMLNCMCYACTYNKCAENEPLIAKLAQFEVC